MAIQMSNREKYFVGSAAVIIVIMIVYQFIITPFTEGASRKKRMVAQKIEQLGEMRDMQGEIETLNEKARALQSMAGKKEPGFTLFSFLDKLAGTTGVKPHINYMKPSEKVEKETQVTLSMVEMKLQGVDMKKLMAFLYEIETSPNGVFVRGLSLTKTGKDKNQLTAILQVETVKQES